MELPGCAAHASRGCKLSVQVAQARAKWYNTRAQKEPLPAVKLGITITTWHGKHREQTIVVGHASKRATPTALTTTNMFNHHSSNKKQHDLAPATMHACERSSACQCSLHAASQR